MLKSLGWESPQDKRRDIRQALMYKIVHAQVAVPTDDLLVKADSRTWANHKHKFCHIPATSAAYKHPFFPRTVPQWNSLPAHLLAPIRLAHSPICMMSHLGSCRSPYRCRYRYVISHPYLCSSTHRRPQTPVQNWCERAFSTRMKSSGLRTDP